MRLWREPREVSHASPKWRGVIIHLISGKTRYFENLDDLVEYIIPFIEEMGVTAAQPEGQDRWFTHWLDSLRKKLK